MISMLFSYAVPPPKSERTSVVAFSADEALRYLQRLYPFTLERGQLQVKINDTWQPFGVNIRD